MADALRIERLRVVYPGPPPVRALDDLSLKVEPGECLGILGESGSGKTTLAMSLLGLLPAAQIGGGIHLGDLDLLALDEKRWREVRWRRISLGFQSPAALNPVLRIGAQLTEPLRVHLGLRGQEAGARAIALLEEVGLGEWAMSRYPRELSGGQKRLVLIGMALACDPDVIILDEPTAGLDPATRARIVEVLSRRRAARDRILVLVSHDPEALQTLADRVAVLYRGWLAENGPAPRVLLDPRNPYSFGLLNAHPTLATVKDIRGIRGEPPNPTEVAAGCPFQGRCTQSVPGCARGRPPYVAPPGEDGLRLVACVRGGVVAVMTARDLSKRFRASSGVLHRETVAAVDGVSLEVRESEVVGLVGSTGAGKSTLARLLVRLLDADSGSVQLESEELFTATGEELKQMRRRVQLLFQDPYEALSPRLTIAQAVREPLDVQEIGSAGERDAAVRRAMASVRLPADDAFLARHTHELSGGQLQRVALARALVVGPKLLIADEPVAMLDPSEQTKVLQLLKTLQVERGMAMVLVSHDLAIVLRAADRVLVLDHGRVVEEGTGTQLLTAPQHPTTRMLLDAAGRGHLFGVNGSHGVHAATTDTLALATSPVPTA